jgi:NAD(P)H dehydrogenase (quinone)
LRPEAFMQNLVAFGWLNRGIITNYIGNSRWSWVDCNDLALVVAKTLQNPESHSGQIYPLGYSAATLQDVADILTEETGQPFALDPRTPEEFLQAMLASGADQAYMHCIYTQFKLNRANAIPNADMVFNNFEQITGQKPTLWHDFVQNHKSEFVYQT